MWVLGESGNITSLEGRRLMCSQRQVSTISPPWPVWEPPCQNRKMSFFSVSWRPSFSGEPESNSRARHGTERGRNELPPRRILRKACPKALECRYTKYACSQE